MSTKPSNLTARQTTLTQMNQSLSSKISQSLQSSSKKKPSITTRPTSSNKKPQIHEIINLQNDEFQNGFNSTNIAQGKNEEAFVAELAKKCGAFFNWINQVDYAIFAEQMWKNKMMALVGDRFPQLNTEEQQKLIDRDWKIMAPQRKQQFLKSIQKQLQFEQMNKMVNEDFQNQRNQIYVQFNGKEEVAPAASAMEL